MSTCEIITADGTFRPTLVSIEFEMARTARALTGFDPRKVWTCSGSFRYPRSRKRRVMKKWAKRNPGGAWVRAMVDPEFRRKVRREHRE